MRHTIVPMGLSGKLWPLGGATAACAASTVLGQHKQAVHQQLGAPDEDRRGVSGLLFRSSPLMA